MKDILSGVGSGLAERISNPLGVSFVISWSIINYRFFLVLLSGMDTLEKFSYIENVHFHGWDFLLYGFAYPFFAAALYVFAFPHISRVVYEYWAGQQNRIKEIIAAAEGNSPMLQDQWRAQKFQLRAEVDRLQKELDEKLLQVAKVRDNMGLIESERDNLKVEAVKQDAELHAIKRKNEELEVTIDSFRSDASRMANLERELSNAKKENSKLNKDLEMLLEVVEEHRKALANSRKDFSFVGGAAQSKYSLAGQNLSKSSRSPNQEEQ